MAIRLNGLAQYNEPVGRDYVDILRFGVAPSFAWGIGTPTLVTASYYYYHENNQPDRGIPIVTFPGQIGGPPDVDPSNYYGHRAAGLREGAPAPRHRSPSTTSSTRTSRSTTSPATSGRIARRGHAGRHPRSRSPPGSRWGRSSSPGTARARRERVDPRQPDRGPVQVQHVDAQAQARRQASTSRTRRTTARRSRSRRARTRRSRTRTPSPPASSPSTNGARFEADATSVGAYVVDDVQILSWLKFMAGARFDNFDSDITNFNANGTVRLEVQPHRPVLVAARRAHRAAHGRADVLLRLGPLLQPVRRARSTRSTSPTRARTPRRPTRTSSAARSASSTTRSA